MTHRVQAKVSPTYAAPKEAGSVSRGVRVEVEVVSADEGWARDAREAMSRDWPKDVAGRGACVARDGRDRRRTLRVRECGEDDWVDCAMLSL